MVKIAHRVDPWLAHPVYHEHEIHGKLAKGLWLRDIKTEDHILRVTAPEVMSWAGCGKTTVDMLLEAQANIRRAHGEGVRLEDKGRDSRPYQQIHITTLRALRDVLKAAQAPVSLDFETTGLDPETAVVRLAQLDWGEATYVIDAWQLEGEEKDDILLSELADAGLDYEAFNAKFELSWFWARGHRGVVVNDIIHYRMAVDGGGGSSFAAALKQDLGVEISKELQVSLWSAPELSPAQLKYAGEDAFYNTEYADHWVAQSDEGQLACADLLNSQIAPALHMQQTGMGMDLDRHGELVLHWKELERHYIAEIRKAVTEAEVVNPGSRAQWSDYLIKILPDEWVDIWPKTEKSGQLAIKKEVLEPAAVMVGEGLLADTLYTISDLFTIRQYLGNFGDKLIGMADDAPDGRIHPRFNIGGARTLRYSSSQPNAQQLPRDRELLGEFTSVRSSFVADPGNHLIAIDYSGIELRVLALLSGDKQLLEDCVEGDVHLEVGSLWQGRTLDKAVAEDKAIRSAAKGISFGIIYGSGALGLAGTMRTGLAAAEAMLYLWERRYPKAFALRNTVMKEAEAAPDPKNKRIRMVDGGTINMGRRPEMPRCANYPVQRAAWSVMARAIARHYETMRGFEGDLDFNMCATIHDQLIDEAKAADAPDVLTELACDMEAAYLDIFPGAPTARLMEGGHGPCWGEIKEDVV